jgi:hypothetical protein
LCYLRTAIYGREIEFILNVNLLKPIKSRLDQNEFSFICVVVDAMKLNSEQASKNMLSFLATSNKPFQPATNKRTNSCKNKFVSCWIRTTIKSG